MIRQRRALSAAEAGNERRRDDPQERPLRWLQPVEMTRCSADGRAPLEHPSNNRDSEPHLNQAPESYALPLHV